MRIRALKCVILFVFAIRSIGATRCPPACRCYQQSGIDTISCARSGLVRLPNYFDFEVKILNLTGNFLPNLTDAFVNYRYDSLEILDLSSNSIRNIDVQTFRSLKNLFEVDLSNNRIETIDGKLFENNRFLNTIHFDGNLIEQIDDYAFAPSTYLHRLDFQGCRIKRIRRYAFVNTPLLRHLNLKDNALKSLSVNVLHFTPQLEILQLDGNPWRCNKKLWLLLKWLHAKNSPIDSLLCVYGETNNAVLWDTMDLSNPIKFRNIKTPVRVKRIRWTRSKRRKRIRRHLANVSSRKQWQQANENATRYSGKDDDDDNSNFISLTASDNDVGSTFRRSYPLVESDSLEQRFAARNPDPYDNEPVFGVPKYSPDENEPRRTFHPQYGVPSSKGRKNHQPPPPPPPVDQESVEIADKFNITTQVKFVDIGSMETNSNSQNGDHKVVDDDDVNRREDEIDGENMSVMLSLIAFEFILLAVLLCVLYWLWIRTKRTNEREINEPLNNGVKNVKTYNTGTQSPGYTRYSLSDDEYTNLRGNVLDETKFDTESGYLSYHRFNSNEGAEINGDNTHHRHNSFQNEEDNEDDTAVLNRSAAQSPNEIPPNATLTIPNGGIYPEYGRRTRHRNNINTNCYNNHPTGGIVRANGANAPSISDEAPICVSDCDEGAFFNSTAKKNT